MNIETLSPIFTFAIASSMTPGPNNLMLLSSGTNFGFKKTIPHMLGIGVGFVVMFILIGIGLMQVFEAYPVIRKILQFFSVAYLLYLSWKIANGSAPKEGEKVGRPFTFLQAALFQWMNPKAWTMAMTAITLFSPSGNSSSIFGVALVFWLVNIPATSFWTIMGHKLKTILRDQRRLKVFNFTMAVLLVSTLYFVF